MTTELNQPAPDISLPDLDGHIHTINNYRDKIVIINFWSAECPHSERFDTHIAARLAIWGSDVALLSIASNTNEPKEMLNKISLERSLPLVLTDADHSVADRYGAQTTPHIFVLDRQGILRYRGAVDDVAFRQRTATHFYLEEAVGALLANELPDVTDTSPYGCTIVRYS
ncbi:MAG: redoxin domain-containing protein [Anaerolineae bacterium]|nr:redoxin domain-containing protein [Anaerolineae bacterium]